MLCDEEIMDEEKDEFDPRPYQSEILEIAIKENTIIYLPTGAGKTYIAIMLINRFSHDIVEPNNKKTVFLVNTVPLVEQHCLTLRRHTDFDIGQFSGDQNVDFWTEDQWITQLAKYQVVILTSQIFLDILRHGYFSLDKVNLLIFDECHQGVNDQPMRQVMQMFAGVSNKQNLPRVLGLTATLLNGNCSPHKVKEEVRSLETTFHSKVATVRELAQVVGFSTNPREQIVYFAAPTSCTALQQSLDIVGRLKQMVCDIDFNLNPCRSPRRTNLLQTREKLSKELSRYLVVLTLHIQMLGVYGGHKSTLSTILALERRKCRAEDNLTERILSVMITTLTAVNKLFLDVLSGYSEEEQIFKFSSPQVLSLIEILRAARGKNTDMCGIIFVKQRFTAKALFYIISALSQCSADFNFISCNFMVGFNASNAEKDTREVMYTAKINKKIVQSFRNNEINLLIASNVVEEGIDIPKCTLVVKFDRPMDYRSYIQSKGRARHGDSSYIIMVPIEESSKYRKSYQTYKEVEQILQEYLVGKTDSRVVPSEAKIKRELYEDQDLPPYCVDGPDSPQVAAVSAISLLNRYCQSLHCDKYSQPTPTWFLRCQSGEAMTGYVVIIEMPIMCPLREPIEGVPMSNKTSAKRAAALEVCKQLHQIGELNNRLLPKTQDDDEEDFEYLFTHWLKDDIDEVNQSKAGTNKRVRQHKVKVPEFLIKQPTSLPDTYYLHPIVMTTIKTEYNSISVQHGLIESNLGYALLTMNRLPNICDFPIFLSGGEVNVHIEVNHSVLNLSESVVSDLKRFNYFLFSDLLSIVKEFLIVDNSGENGVLLVVPMNKSESDYIIDMSIACEHTSLERVIEPMRPANEEFIVTDESHLGKVVCPWYRGNDDNYIVTRVCHELNAMSPFPSNHFPSYEAYYLDKYNTRIKHATQPLLLVKGISKRLNCLLPRSVSIHGAGSKRSKYAMQDGSEEHLIPELVVLQQYPGSLWFQANCLPSIVHRLMYLLRAESLRRNIAKDTGIGKVEQANWEPLPVDQRVFHNEENKKPQPVTQRNVSEVDAAALPPAEVKPKPPTNKDYSAKMLEKQYTWTDEQEPIDIERNIESLTLFEIEDYVNFVSAPCTANDIEKVLSTPKSHFSKFPALTLKQEYEQRPIQMLNEKPNSVGPQQWCIFQCLMASKANEIVNLERLETLGDSFLKLSASLFLLLKYPNYTEGRLTTIKGKIIGNKNLLYCGLKKNLGGHMKVNDFSPKTDWLLPGYCVPKILQENIENKIISVNKLFEFGIAAEEQIAGEIHQESKQNIEEIIKDICANEDEPPLESNSNMYNFLGYQFVRDKTVSDCVEALLGAYLQSNGIVGALKILGWLEVIPNEFEPSQLFLHQPPNPLVHNSITPKEIDFYLPNYRKLEKHLGYKFRNRAYLLQALTHSSYTTNRLTDCYQRLEFLGDAVLDFLITCHIYEVSDQLTPGELTDLRSALVNNVTFAGLVVRNGFHKHLKFINTKLMDIIDKFVKFQEEREYAINEEALILVEDDPLYMAEHVMVPKVLGDLFESLAGAVFLDTGMNLQETWLVFHKLMWHEIENFRRCVPKNPVRMLYENGTAAFDFGEPKLMDNGNTLISIVISMNGKKHEVYGVGENKSQAKRAAAKMALRVIRCD